MISRQDIVEELFFQMLIWNKMDRQVYCILPSSCGHLQRKNQWEKSGEQTKRFKDSKHK